MIKDIQHLIKVIEPWFRGKILLHEMDDFVTWVKLKLESDEREAQVLVGKAAGAVDLTKEPESGAGSNG